MGGDSSLIGQGAFDSALIWSQTANSGLLHAVRQIFALVERGRYAVDGLLFLCFFVVVVVRVCDSLLQAD